MLRSLHCLLASLLAGLLSVPPAVFTRAYAQPAQHGSPAGVGAMAFASHADLRLEEVAVSITLARVRLRYAIRNTSHATVTTDATIRLPEQPAPEHGAFAEAPRDPVNIVDLAVWSDTQTVLLAFDRKALVREHDVTAALSTQSVPLAPALAVTAHAVTELPAAVKADFVEQGLLRKHTFSNGYGEHVDLVPNWDLVTTALWQQSFPPNAVTTIEISYAPPQHRKRLSIGPVAPRKARVIRFLSRLYCVPETSPFVTERIEAVAPRRSGDVLDRVWIDVALVPEVWLDTEITRLSIAVDMGVPKARVALCRPEVQGRPAQGLTYVARDVRITRSLPIAALVPPL